MRDSESKTAIQMLHQFRLWHRHFNVPIFVPPEGPRVLRLLDRSGSSAFISELRRMADLGSAWACATLGYICLQRWRNGQRCYQQALEICSGPSSANDPYAQFVMAWALYFDKEYSRAATMMLMSANQQFLPAIVDRARFAIKGIGFKRQDPQTEFLMLRTTIKSGHHMGWPIFSERCRSGRFGWRWRIIGYLLAPYTVTQFVLALLSNPMSADIVSLNLGHKAPVLIDPI
jgi:hypothetical protein